jgi:hypothetical protein
MSHPPKLLQWADSNIQSPHDAAARGAFLDLAINKATALVEKTVSNQGWSE